MQRCMPSRLFKSFLWTTAFVVAGTICFYGYTRNMPNMRETIRMMGTTYSRYDGNPYNNNSALRFNRTLISTTRPSVPSYKVYGLLKVHKAASSTTQGIFLRYGWKRDLTFVLPPEYNAFGYPNIISINESMTNYNILPPPKGKSFDILCHHVVYDKFSWNKVLSPNAAKIGTVREPFSHFKSSLNYFNPRVLQRIKTPNPVRTYLENPQKYESGNIRMSFINNRISFEYGVDPDIIQKRDFGRFERYLWDVLDKDFAVVLVNEMFDESLIVLKRKLNWELKDILYISQNVRSSNKQDRYILTDGDKTLHQKFAAFDYMLYNFFVKKLEHIIASSPRILQEIEHFQKVKHMLTDYCFNALRLRGAELAIDSAVLAIDATEWNDQFNVTVADCRQMIKGEIQFTQDIRRKQYGYATWTWPGQG